MYVRSKPRCLSTVSGQVITTRSVACYSKKIAEKNKFLEALCLLQVAIARIAKLRDSGRTPFFTIYNVNMGGHLQIFEISFIPESIRSYYPCTVLSKYYLALDATYCTSYLTVDRSDIDRKIPFVFFGVGFSLQCESDDLLEKLYTMSIDDDARDRFYKDCYKAVYRRCVVCGYVYCFYDTEIWQLRSYSCQDYPRHRESLKYDYSHPASLCRDRTLHQKLPFEKTELTEKGILVRKAKNYSSNIVHISQK